MHQEKVFYLVFSKTSPVVMIVEKSALARVMAYVVNPNFSLRSSVGKHCEAIAFVTTPTVELLIFTFWSNFFMTSMVEHLELR